PVDVVERTYRPSYRITGEAVAPATLVPANLTPQQKRRSRLTVIIPGISIGHPSIKAGTFGAVVYDALNGTPYILSNWHVLNGPKGKIGDAIVQPGPFDDGNISSNVVGRLVRSHLGLAGDCAISSIVGRGLDERVFELNVAPKRIAIASIGDKVVKSGRTTGVTYGIVSRVGVVIKMNYGGNVGEQEVGGFEISPNPDKLPADGQISARGDSGSLWLVDTAGADKDVALGLHLAGGGTTSPEEEYAVACNIHSVMQKLQVTITKP
ncbi:MAG: S1 family peptidase, partial [Acidobacteria bacterium]|nr:S1 family peptidase [Acidobacteriota bacterium]